RLYFPLTRIPDSTRAALPLRTKRETLLANPPPTGHRLDGHSAQSERDSPARSLALHTTSVKKPAAREAWPPNRKIPDRKGRQLPDADSSTFPTEAFPAAEAAAEAVSLPPARSP